MVSVDGSYKVNINGIGLSEYSDSTSLEPPLQYLLSGQRTLPQSGHPPETPTLHRSLHAVLPGYRVAMACSQKRLKTVLYSKLVHRVGDVSEEGDSAFGEDGWEG